MSNGSRRNSWNPFGPDANRFTFCNYDYGDDLDEVPYCTWWQCAEPQCIGPVCIKHAILIALEVKRADDANSKRRMQEPQRPPLADAPGWVYYLMVGPSTVKIGTTKVLAQRMNQLRSDVQYVVALERGSYDVERERHRQFATERIFDNREDFALSDRLKAHIESLQPERDELVAIATSGKPYADARPARRHDPAGLPAAARHPPP